MKSYSDTTNVRKSHKARIVGITVFVVVVLVGLLVFSISFRNADDDLAADKVVESGDSVTSQHGANLTTSVPSAFSDDKSSMTLSNDTNSGVGIEDSDIEFSGVLVRLDGMRDGKYAIQIVCDAKNTSLEYRNYRDFPSVTINGTQLVIANLGEMRGGAKVGVTYMGDVSIEDTVVVSAFGGSFEAKVSDFKGSDIAEDMVRCDKSSFNPVVAESLATIIMSVESGDPVDSRVLGEAEPSFDSSTVAGLNDKETERMRYVTCVRYKDVKSEAGADGRWHVSGIVYNIMPYETPYDLSVGCWMYGIDGKLVSCTGGIDSTYLSANEERSFEFVSDEQRKVSTFELSDQSAGNTLSEFVDAYGVSILDGIDVESL